MRLSRLQRALHETLNETMAETGAKGAWGVVLEPGSAEVLAMVSLPDYDPNHFGKAPKESWMNRATYGVYEMGSIFKVLTMAQALEEGLITPASRFDCTEPIRIGNFTIRDASTRHREWLSAKEIFRYSSNIGVARIADEMDAASRAAFYERLHLLSPLDPGVADVATPLVPDQPWGRIRRISMGYGYGLAVTPLHLAAAVNALVTDGVYRMPTLVKRHEEPLPEYVVSPETVTQIRALMRDAVQNGTGQRAQVIGYDIGGKTGTAEKTKTGGYHKSANRAAFVGAVPLENPRLLVLIMVDEGYDGAGQGGSTAAPAFSAFIRRAAPLLGLRPSVNDHSGGEGKHATIRPVGRTG